MSAIRLGTLRLPAAFVLGLLFSQAFSPGILWGLLGAAALFAQLQLIVAAPRCREAALIAFCFGLGWFGAGLSWTMESMHAHGGLPTWAAAVGLALLATVCSAFGAAAAAAARRAVRRPLFAPFAYASALILAHNHPSGCAEPSKADKLITERIIKSCQFMDLRVLDHIVIGRGEYVSFAERGWI